MPWSPQQAHQHHRGLSEHLARQWADVANSVLDKTGDDGRAIREANAAVDRTKAKGKR